MDRNLHWSLAGDSGKESLSGQHIAQLLRTSDLPFLLRGLETRHEIPPGSQTKLNS